MAFQLVYTSAAKLLDAGRSGYGTVARSKSITSLVVSAIERVSQFANQRGLDRHRVIYVHRRITAGSNRFHVLTRIGDAGADYTGRTNHLAHHLVISQEEAARAAARGVTPADVLRQFPWLGRWDGSARFFDSSDDVALENIRPDGKDSKRQLWSSVTGNPAHTRLLSWDGAPRTGVLIVPDSVDPLALLAEALGEFGPQSWSRSFTTSLETTDELSDLEWIVTTPAVFPEIQPRCGSRALLDLTDPGSLPIPTAPALPTPQLAPASNPTNTSGVYTSPAPDLSSRQPASNPVVVRVADKSDRAAASVRRRPNPKEDRKTQIKLVVGLAALLLCVGLLVLAATKDKTGRDLAAYPNADKKNSDHKLTDPQARAVQDLENLPIAKTEAKRIVEGIVSAGGDAPRWVNYVIVLNKQLKGFMESSSPPDLASIVPAPDDRNPPESPPGSPPWSVSLVQGAESLRNLATPVDSQSPSKRFQELDLAIKSLKSAIDEYGLPALKQADPDLEDLFCKIAEPWLNELIANKNSEEFGKVRNISELWESGKFQKRHNLIEGKIKELEGTKEVSSKILSVVKDPLQTIVRLSESDRLRDVPPKQIILVSRDELKRGVPIKLLESIMKGMSAWKKPVKIELKNLKLEVFPANIRNFGGVDLNLTDEKDDSYCWTVDGVKKVSAPKYFINGSFALDNAQFDRVRFSYPDREAWIAVDEKSKDVIIPDLNFRIELQDEVLRISGTLAEWITNVQNTDTNLRLLINESGRFSAKVLVPGATIADMPDWPTYSVSEKILPLIKVNGTDNKDMVDLSKEVVGLRKKIETSNAISKTNQKDKESRDELKSMCGKLFTDLEEAIGRTFTCRILGNADDDFDVYKINKDSREKTISNLKAIVSDVDTKKLQEKSGEWETEAEKPDKEISKNNVKTQSSHFFELLGSSILEHPEQFDLKVFKSKDLDAIRETNGVIKDEKAAVEFFERFLKNAYELPVPIKQRRRDYLENITTLTVQTQKSRVLFKATKKP